MSVRRNPSFTLRDAMLIVALAALGLAAGKAYVENDRTGSWPGTGKPGPASEWILGGLTCALLVGSMGLLVLRFLRGPHRRRVVLGAGTAAGLAIVGYSALVTLTWMNSDIHLLLVVGSLDGPLVRPVVMNLARGTGQSVLIVWMILALARVWRARDWIERAGVTLGAAWVVLYIDRSFLSWWFAW